MKLSQVVLADATKRLIVDTVQVGTWLRPVVGAKHRLGCGDVCTLLFFRDQDYDRFCEIRRTVGFDEVVRFGSAAVGCR